MDDAADCTRRQDWVQDVTDEGAGAIRCPVFGVEGSDVVVKGRQIAFEALCFVSEKYFRPISSRQFSFVSST